MQSSTTPIKNLKKKFTPEEDQLLRELVQQHGTHNWTLISSLMGTRNCRQCRERWRNYLSQKVSTEPWSKKEDMLLQQKFMELGPQWTKIQAFFTDRTDVNLKNRWAVLQRRRNHKLSDPNLDQTVRIIPRAPQQVPQKPIQLPQQPAVVEESNSNEIMNSNLNSNTNFSEDLFSDDLANAFDLFSSSFNDGFDKDIFVLL
ncbi:Myb-like DNA-binding domain containing protein [Histomonas meleagridis]|uniref:Myb-like DNA-binding domain containing protein n=1 Tax=Histomonas meleagridis TaxID=135588 RepID=UPI003559CFFF|nr:Myb-like DNA-binding domain containing protein [Histomonas meleagridis]KAH0797932.1 Myb-like DNA-binding domain containing protein [Histomonas meleagridis]